MKKFNIWYKIEGPGGTLEVPNVEQPVEVESLQDVLKIVATTKLPGNELLILRGIRIEEATPPDP